MPLWGLDISDYQPVLDAPRAVREGFDFVVSKSTEGSGWRANTFGPNLHNCRNAGLVFAAYHYVRAGDPVGQVNNIKAVVPRDCPLILDVESGSGGVGHVWDLTNRLRDAGYHLPLTYFPRWYWQQIGSPSLAGLPPLWKSHYPDMAGGTVSGIYGRVPGSYWNGYGGNQVEILQFTSSATAVGISPIDGNAYRGTRQQLEVLIYSQEGDLNAEQSQVLDEIFHQVDHGWQPWPDGWDAGTRTLTDLIREADKNLFYEMKESAGDEAAMQALVDALNAEILDVEQLKAVVRRAAADGLKNSVVDLNLSVTSGEGTGDGGH
ncbi:glycoside hydrolase family 25 protein [Actinopolyspora halophila]|uniref:glycoside hydrolase family 25 protein n=1 Tax=Actinopolyspora halophila TaxID=1850 RepID=UPI00035FC16C|nr:glycoside hydrolase family 25 protein [Actinopolyspora halophila]